jgi:hypothetical protein
MINVRVYHGNPAFLFFFRAEELGYQQWQWAGECRIPDNYPGDFNGAVAALGFSTIVHSTSIQRRRHLPIHKIRV